MSDTNLRYDLLNTIATVLQSNLLGARETFSDMHLTLLSNYCCARIMMNGGTDDIQYSKVSDLAYTAITFHSLMVANLRNCSASITVKEVAGLYNDHVIKGGYYVNEQGMLEHNVLQDTEQDVNVSFCCANLIAQGLTGVPYMSHLLVLLELFGVADERSMITMLQRTELFFDRMIEGYTEVQSLQLLDQDLQKVFKPMTKQ